MGQILEVKTIVETKSAEKDVENLTNKIDDSTEATEGMSGALDKMTGGAITAFKGVVSGVKKGVMAMKTLKGAIMATGIGALVVAVGALTAAFKGSEEGQNKFAKITGVVGAVVGNLVDLLADLGEKLISVFENPKQSVIDVGNAIKENITNRIDGMLELLPALGKAIKLAMNLEFSEAAKVAGNAAGKVLLGVENIVDKVEDATEAVKTFVKENIKEGEAAGRVADMRARADKIERGLLLRRAKAEREIAELRLKAKDVANVSSEERKQALEDVLVLQDSLIGSEQEIANLRRDAQIAENGFARSTKENLLEEETLKAEAVAVETRRLNQKRQIARELSATEIEIAANTAADIAAKQAEADKKRLDDIKAIDNEQKQYKLENNEAKLVDFLIFEERKMQLELEQLDLTEAGKEAIRLKYKEKQVASEIEFNKSIQAAKEALQNKEMAIANSTVGFLNQIAGKNKGLAIAALALEKGQAIAGVVVNAGKEMAANNAMAAANPANIATAGAAGVAQAAALNTRTKINAALNIASITAAGIAGARSISSSGAGGGVGGGAGGYNEEIPRIPNFEANNQGVGGRNSFGNVRAVVVQQDIKDSASLDSRVDDLIKVGK
tara:strand:+ start:755 stop:2596 length:1842 start_codon:yes stop_codon:yes gene_type:complete